MMFQATVETYLYKEVFFTELIRTLVNNVDSMAR